MHWPPWAEVLSRVNHFMLAVNSSINIFIYVIKVMQFISKDPSGVLNTHIHIHGSLQDFKFRSAMKSMVTVNVNVSFSRKRNSDESGYCLNEF